MENALAEISPARNASISATTGTTPLSSGFLKEPPAVQTGVGEPAKPALSRPSTKPTVPKDLRKSPHQHTPTLAQDGPLIYVRRRASLSTYS